MPTTELTYSSFDASATDVFHMDAPLVGWTRYRIIQSINDASAAINISSRVRTSQHVEDHNKHTVLPVHLLLDPPFCEEPNQNSRHSDGQYGYCHGYSIRIHGRRVNEVVDLTRRSRSRRSRVRIELGSHGRIKTLDVYTNVRTTRTGFLSDSRVRRTQGKDLSKT